MNQPQRVPRNTVPNRLLRTFLAVVSLAMGAATLISGCASTPEQPQSMRDPQADFTTYKTFGWKTGTGADKSDQPVSLIDGYVRTAITTELTRKGYMEATVGKSPDLRVDYEAVSAEKLKSNPFRIGIGVGGWGGNTGGSVGVGSPSVKNVKEGTLVVHVIDLARNSEVWQGRASREMGKGNVEPAAVQSVVTELLRDFPARRTQP